jgi:hypothetical protein
MSNVPTARTVRLAEERERIRRVVERRGLCGLANDTKWDEFIHAMRTRPGWTPSYRVKRVDGPPSDWDVEWIYHLPFPMASVEWMDVAHLQEVVEHRLPPRVTVIDHSQWLAPLLNRVGLDHQVGKKMIRIFGYSPRAMELFDE